LEVRFSSTSGRDTDTAYRPNITIFFTFLAVGVSFAWLGVEDPSRWRAGVALYILGCKIVSNVVVVNVTADGPC